MRRIRLYLLILGLTLICMIWPSAVASACEPAPAHWESHIIQVVFDPVDLPDGITLESNEGAVIVDNQTDHDLLIGPNPRVPHDVIEAHTTAHYDRDRVHGLFFPYMGYDMDNDDSTGEWILINGDQRIKVTASLTYEETYVPYNPSACSSGIFFESSGLLANPVAIEIGVVILIIICLLLIYAGTNHKQRLH